MNKLLEDVNELLSLGLGDHGRLTHIKNSFENNKTLFISDQKYVENLITKHLQSTESSAKQPSNDNQNTSISKTKRRGTSQAGRVATGIGIVVFIFIVLVILLPEFEPLYVSDDIEYIDEYAMLVDDEYAMLVDDEYAMLVDDEYFLLDQQQLQEDLREEPFYQENDLLQQENEDLRKKVAEEYAQRNPVISGLINGNLTYYVEPLPSWSTYNVSSFDNHLDGRHIEGIKIRKVSDKSQADFTVRWIKDYGAKTLGVAYSRTTATVGLGSSNCSGEWQHFDDYSITKITWHEIGHVLGYNHSDDENNIMYSTTYTKYKHDKDIKKVIAGGWSNLFEFCNDGEQYYHFKTDKTKYDGFEIFVVPPETDVKEFLSGDGGKYYSSCEELDKKWFAKGNTCNVKKGSKIVIHNTNDKAIKIEGYIKDKEPHPEIETRWDDDFYEYNQEYLNYIRDLYHK